MMDLTTATRKVTDTTNGLISHISPTTTSASSSPPHHHHSHQTDIIMASPPSTVFTERKKLSFSVASLLEKKSSSSSSASSGDHGGGGGEPDPGEDHHRLGLGHDRLKEELPEEDEEEAEAEEEDGYSEDEDIDPGQEDGEAVSPPPSSLPHHPLAAYPHPALLAMQKDRENSQHRLFSMFPQGISQFNQAMFRSGMQMKFKSTKLLNLIRRIH